MLADFCRKLVIGHLLAECNLENLFFGVLGHHLRRKLDIDTI